MIKCCHHEPNQLLIDCSIKWCTCYVMVHIHIETLTGWFLIYLFDKPFSHIPSLALPPLSVSYCHVETMLLTGAFFPVVAGFNFFSMKVSSTVIINTCISFDCKHTPLNIILKFTTFSNDIQLICTPIPTILITIKHFYTFAFSSQYHND